MARKLPGSGRPGRAQEAGPVGSGVRVGATRRAAACGPVTSLSARVEEPIRSRTGREASAFLRSPSLAQAPPGSVTSVSKCFKVSVLL